MDLLARNLIKSIREKYASLDSYHDSGVVETVFHQGTSEQWTSKTLFRTIFLKPSFFRFERRFKLAGEQRKEISLVVWFDGKAGYSSKVGKRVEKIGSLFSWFHSKEKILDTCLCDCFPFAGIVSRVVPPLLFPHLAGTNFVERTEWNTNQSNRDCYVLSSGNASIVLPRDSLWVSQILELSGTSSTTTNIRPTAIDVRASHFDKRRVMRELNEDRILEDMRAEVGPLCIFDRSQPE